MDETVDVTLASDVPVRLAGADRLFEEVDRLVEGWSLAHRCTAAVRISPLDGGVLEVVAPPAVESFPFEWSTKFGYGVHDLRSGLDHLAQQLCRLEGEEPKEPRHVQFPVADTGDSWRTAKRGLRSMPPSLLARIESLQPCKSTGDLVDGLVLLNQLAVHDKHYELTPLMLIPSEISLKAIEPWPTEGADDVDWNTLNMRLHITPAAGQDARGLKGVLPMSYSPILLLGDRMAPLQDVMPWLLAVTRAVIDTVTVGASSKVRPPAPVWATFPADTEGPLVP